MEAIFILMTIVGVIGFFGFLMDGRWPAGGTSMHMPVRFVIGLVWLVCWTVLPLLTGLGVLEYTPSAKDCGMRNLAQCFAFI